MFKVSPSQIGSLLECPRCLWLHYREQIERPRGIFPSLPSGIDGILKNYFDKFRETGHLPPEIEGKIDARMFQDVARLNQWRNNRIGLQAEFPELDIFLKGAIDELFVSTDNKYIPFDFKTRGYPVKEDTERYYQIQLDLYALLFEKNNLAPADYGYLLFFSPLEYENGSVKFLSELIKMNVDSQRGYNVLRRVKEITSGSIPEAHMECEYCAYRRLEMND